jgi:hypothetical protein
MSNRNLDEEIEKALKNSADALKSIRKENLYVPDSYNISMGSKEVYPVHLICTHHKFIEQMEIPNDDFIRLKLKGCDYWIRLYLPYLS